MKKLKFITTIAIGMIVLFGACKKEDVNSTSIPVQTAVQAIIPLAGASNLAVLAGASITNTDETNITGDMGLSPGTSMGGFPPGILNGMILINDAVANQSKLDLVVAYNNASGRTATDMLTVSW